MDFSKMKSHLLFLRARHFYYKYIPITWNAKNFAEMQKHNLDTKIVE